MDGDINTKIFHNNTRQRRIINKNNKVIKDNGDLVEDPIELSAEIVRHFNETLNNRESLDLRAQTEMLRHVP